jgi:hypothetical protein
VVVTRIVKAKQNNRYWRKCAMEIHGVQDEG